MRREKYLAPLLCVNSHTYEIYICIQSRENIPRKRCLKIYLGEIYLLYFTEMEFCLNEIYFTRMYISSNFYKQIFFVINIEENVTSNNCFAILRHFSFGESSFIKKVLSELY